MIGIFDSGLGGLTVAKAIMKRLPEYDVIYFGDTARTPYGSKSKQTVIQYSIENTKFLIKQGAKFIVMACNTASSVATDILRNQFDIPIFEVITPAVELTLKGHPLIVGIIGTRATINSNVYVDKIKSYRPDIQVYGVACPLLVPLVEEGWLNKPETRMIAKKYLSSLKMRKIDTLILGCTHYPIIKSIIQSKIGKRVRIIDSAQAVADQVAAYLTYHEDSKPFCSQEGHYQFYVSDITPHFEQIAESIFNRHISLQLTPYA